MNQTDLQGETERALRAITCVHCRHGVTLIRERLHHGRDWAVGRNEPCTSAHEKLLPLFNAGMEQAVVAAEEAYRLELADIVEKQFGTRLVASTGALDRYVESTKREWHKKGLHEGTRQAKEFGLGSEQAVAGAYAAAAKHHEVTIPCEPGGIVTHRGACSCGGLVADGVTPWAILWERHILALTPADARQAQQSKPLFVAGEFTSHSGLKLPYKIDCDALSDADIETLASIAAGKRNFSGVIPVPNGGFRLAKALEKYAMPHSGHPRLIVDDVLTTGASILEHRLIGDEIGVVIFARGQWPEWVTPLFVDAAAIASAEARGVRKASEALMTDWQKREPSSGAWLGRGVQAALLLERLATELEAAARTPDRPTAIDGTCCSCGYSGEEETPCPKQEDGHHCVHWYEGDSPDSTTNPHNLGFCVRFASNETCVGCGDKENGMPIVDRCHADRDGDCNWPECPQNRDGEPAKSQRHCPLDTPDSTKEPE